MRHDRRFASSHRDRSLQRRAHGPIRTVAQPFRSPDREELYGSARSATRRPSLAAEPALGPRSARWRVAEKAPRLELCREAPPVWFTIV